jgi:DNA-binding transcriptional LysR family regulator
MLDKIGTFVRIADAGSISRAARSLGLSVGMASRHLQTLEQDLGAQLMRRTTRRIDLTEAGEEFLARARALLSDLEDAKQAVRSGRVVTGKIVLSVPACLGIGKLVPLIPGLLEMHPGLHVDLRFEEHGIDLLADGIDIAVRIDVELHSSPFLVARKIASFERILCAAPSFLKHHGGLVSIAGLAHIPCILEGGPRQKSWCFETSSGFESVTVQGRVRTDNVLAAREVLIAGAGVGWLPCWLAREECRSGRLKRVLPDAKVAPVTVYLLTHKQVPGSRATVRAVVDYLATELPRHLGLQGEAAVRS